MFRKLRIAFSVVCGIVCLLLILLWARSYWATDLISRIDSRKIATTFGSQYGALYFAHFDAEIAYTGTGNSSAPRQWAYKSLGGYHANNGLFVWKRSESSLKAALPHWAVAILALMIGAGSWLPWRFSLRSLLIATTLVALLLGAVVYALR
jgi:hypothetical protein